MALGTRLYYSSNNDPATETWTEETAKVKLEIVDVLNAPTVVQASIINTVVAGVHSKNAIYTPYRRIKVTEYVSGLTLFVGRVDSTQSTYDFSYGQILILTAKDYMQNYADRIVAPTGAFLATWTAQKRATIISGIASIFNTPNSVVDYSNINTTLNTETISRDYSKANKTALTVIEELAEEDPWTNTSWYAVWKYTSSESDVTDIDVTYCPFLATNTQKFHFGQPNPFAGLNVTAMSSAGTYGTFTYSYWNGSTWVALTVLQDSTLGFHQVGLVRWQVPLDWVARKWNGEANDSYWIQITVSSVTANATFKAQCLQGIGGDYYLIYDPVDGVIPQLWYDRRGATSGTSQFVISLGATEDTVTRAMLADYDFYTEGQETYTRVVSKGLASDGTIVTSDYDAATPIGVNTALETSLHSINEYYDFISGTDMDAAALKIYLNSRATNLASNRSVTVQRGHVSIFRYPYYYSGTYHLIKAGDCVRIICPLRGINQIFIISKIDYIEPNGIAQLELISCSEGRSSNNPTSVTSMLDTFKTGNDAPVPASKVSDALYGAGGSGLDVVAVTVYTSAQRVGTTTYTNGSYLRIVHIYSRGTSSGALSTAVVDSVSVARAENNYDGASLTFVVGKGKTYHVNYSNTTNADFIWTEWDIG